MKFLRNPNSNNREINMKDPILNRTTTMLCLLLKKQADSPSVETIIIKPAPVGPVVMSNIKPNEKTEKTKAYFLIFILIRLFNSSITIPRKINISKEPAMKLFSLKNKEAP
jgi:hypothetical protein